MKIALDFDGVVHSASSGWKGTTAIVDPPTEGAIEWMSEAITSGHEIIIHTSRFCLPHEYPDEAHYHDGFSAEQIVKSLQDWMLENGLCQSHLEAVKFHTGHGKPFAHVYIDDRGYRFEGVFPELNYLESLPIWNQHEPTAV